MKVVFASDNAGKIKELQSLLEPTGITLIPQKELDVDDIAETGLTFVENALIKARHACRVTGLAAIADDSGLDVFALGGAPGIYSARYAGEHATSQDNISKLLKEMKSFENEERNACFRCVLTFLRQTDDPSPLICEGSWYGSILKTPQGEQGFGYDPIFFDPALGCSAAELALDKKNQVSHRAKALRILLEKLYFDRNFKKIGHG